MRTLRKVIGVIFYLIAAVALILAFFCLVEGFKSSNWFGGIAAAVIVIIVALAAFVIGWYIANPGEWGKATSTTPKKTADSKSKKETAPQRHVETPRLQSAVEKSTPQAETSPATHVPLAPIKAEPKPSANAAAKEPVVSAPRIAVKTNASASRIETIDGSYIGKVYVYDPKPVLKMREGQEALLQVCRRSVKLKSALTRNIWSSGVDSGFAVEYKAGHLGWCSTTSRKDTSELCSPPARRPSICMRYVRAGISAAYRRSRYSCRRSMRRGEKNRGTMPWRITACANNWVSRPSCRTRPSIFHKPTGLPTPRWCRKKDTHCSRLMWLMVRCLKAQRRSPYPYQ